MKQKRRRFACKAPSQHRLIGPADTVGDAEAAMIKTHEHRWSSRQAVETGLRIYANGQWPWLGRIRNLSIGGIFAEIDARNLSPNTHVDVTFILHHRAELSHHRLPARVIRVGPDGAGLMFTDFRRETLEVLRMASRSDLALSKAADLS